MAQIIRILTELPFDGIRFNDAKTDSKGRLYLGTMISEETGTVFDFKKVSLLTVDDQTSPRVLEDYLTDSFIQSARWILVPLHDGRRPRRNQDKGRTLKRHGLQRQDQHFLLRRLL